MKTRFLETITFLGDNILVPIDKINYICLRYTTGWEIHIVGENNMDLSEHFEKDDDKAFVRYKMIKKIVNGK